MCSEFESNDVADMQNDVTDVQNDVADLSDDVECDTTELDDTTEELDDMLAGMSLEELHELRDSLTERDVSDTGDEIPDISDITPIEEAGVPDYSFHWDGRPTHNTEWDEDPEPTAYTKKLTR